MDVQARLEGAKAALVDYLTREVEVRNAITTSMRRREELGRQLDRRRSEEDECARRQRDITEQLVQRGADLAAARQRLAMTTGEKESRAHHLGALAEARRRWEREATGLEAALLQTRSRVESLEQIQQNYEGYQRGVRAIMRAEEHPAGRRRRREYEAPAGSTRWPRVGGALHTIADQSPRGPSTTCVKGGRARSFIPLEPRRPSRTRT
jgi:chromosome segregation ATPase